MYTKVRQDHNIQGINSHSAEQGESLKLTCNSFGKPKWYFQKYKNDVEVYLISTNTTFHLGRVQQYHSGVYFCYGQLETLQHFLSEKIIYVYGKNNSNHGILKLIVTLIISKDNI